MYQNSFYITENIGNNALSYYQRTNKKLFVPSLKTISSFDKIDFWDEIAFEDYDFDDILQSCKGLKNFYKMSWRWKPLYLFDNHNHAYYFFYLARYESYISDWATLFHVDEHADMRDPGEYLMKPNSLDMEKVFQYTNFSQVNVGNYIIPAQKEGLLWDVIQIRNEKNLLDYESWSCDTYTGNIILNLDLDFFEPELDFIDYDLKKRVILDMAERADFITVATSPFFIDQQLALKVFRDIFNH